MEEEKPKKSSSRDYQMLGIRIVGDFGASIAMPVVVLVLIGQYADKTYNRSPLFTILGFILAALISAKIIHKKAQAYGAEYKRLNDAGKKNKPMQDLEEKK
jgi:F0F1-type ATP synthase assembly protein I